MSLHFSCASFDSPYKYPCLLEENKWKCRKRKPRCRATKIYIWVASNVLHWHELYYHKSYGLLSLVSAHKTFMINICTFLGPYFEYSVLFISKTVLHLSFEKTRHALHVFHNLSFILYNLLLRNKIPRQTPCMWKPTSNAQLGSCNV